jgi:L-lactate permease
MLPGLWLFGTVVVPSAAAAVLAWRKSAYAPPVVLLASAALALELLVQIPFLGPSLLQAIMGTIAIGMAVVAIRARGLGWWPRAARTLGPVR